MHGGAQPRAHHDPPERREKRLDKDNPRHRAHLPPYEPGQPRPPPPLSALPQPADDLKVGARADDPPLVRAVRARSTADVLDLLDAGADVNTPTVRGHTPLMLACRGLDMELTEVRLLLHPSP